MATLILFLTNQIPSLPDYEAVRIFVEFTRVESAIKGNGVHYMETFMYQSFQLLSISMEDSLVAGLYPEASLITNDLQTMT